QSPHLWALFMSPTGNGLKAVFRVPADPLKHVSSFFAVEQHILALAGIQIDKACKDVARMCFVSFDSAGYLNEDACEIAPLMTPENLAGHAFRSEIVVDLIERRRIAVEFLGQIQWSSDTSGYCTCPGKHLHTSCDGVRDCEIHLDGVPTLHCFHNSC